MLSKISFGKEASSIGHSLIFCHTLLKKFLLRFIVFISAILTIFQNHCSAICNGNILISALHVCSASFASCILIIPSGVALFSAFVKFSKVLLYTSFSFQFNHSFSESSKIQAANLFFAAFSKVACWSFKYLATTAFLSQLFCFNIVSVKSQ